MLFVRCKFRHNEYNNTTPCTHSIHHSFASDTCWRPNKMARFQIFVAQTALCTICRLKSAFHTCTPGIRKLWNKIKLEFCLKKNNIHLKQLSY